VIKNEKETIKKGYIPKFITIETFKKGFSLFGSRFTDSCMFAKIKAAIFPKGRKNGMV